MNFMYVTCRAIVIFLLCVTLAPTSFALPEFPGKGFDGVVSLAGIEKLHRDGIAFLIVNVGNRRAQRITDQLTLLSSTSRIVSACLGSFEKPGSTDVAVALVGADLSRVDYVALLESAGTYTLSSLPASPTDKNTLPKTPSVRCEPWTGLERINNIYTRQEARKKDSPPLKARSKLDAPCIVPMNSDLEYVCFNFMSKRNKFENIGGWRAD